LAWDSTDYDTDKTLTINVAGAAYDEGAGVLTKDITLTATDEPTVTIVASDVAIYDGDVGVDAFTIEATFTKTMATGTIPTVVFDPVLDTTLTNPTGAWSVNDTVYTWTYDIADAGVEVADVDVTVDGGKDENGVDQESKTNTDYIDVDTQNPTVALTYTRTSDDSAVSGNVFPAEGIRITATFSEAVDENTVPTIAVDTPSSDLAASNMTKTSGIVWYYDWTVPANTNPDAQGIATSTIVATDIAGNSNATATSNTLTIDNLAPAITSVTLDKDQYRLTQDLTVTAVVVEDNTAATVTVSGETAVESPAGTWTGSFTHGKTTVGTYSFNVVATDANGNARTQLIQYKVVAADAPAAPVVAITAPTGGEQITAASYSITFTTDGTTTTAAYVLIDGASWVAATTNANPGTYTLDVSVLNNGSHTVQVKDTVNGVVGYSNTVTFITAYQSDSTHPTVSSIYPVNGAPDVAVSATPYVIFSEAMSPDSISSSTIMLCLVSEVEACTTATEADLLMSPDGKKVHIIPENYLSFNTGYFIRVTTGVTDSAGNALESAYGSTSISAFTTVAEGVGTLSIDGKPGITKSVAHATGEWSDGWIFNIQATIPTNIGHGIQMIFDNWKQSGATAISVANNIRFSVDGGTVVTITAAANAAWDNWLPTGWLDISGVSDADSSRDGKQITIKVETKIPDTVTLGGSYSAAFALNAE